MATSRMVGKVGGGGGSAGWPVGIIDSECPGKATLTGMPDGRYLLLVDTGSPEGDEAVADRLAAKLDEAFAREAGQKG